MCMTGYPIDWTGISQAEMVHASIAAYNSDAAELAGLIRRALLA